MICISPKLPAYYPTTYEFHVVRIAAYTCRINSLVAAQIKHVTASLRPTSPLHVTFLPVFTHNFDFLPLHKHLLCCYRYIIFPPMFESSFPYSIFHISTEKYLCISRLISRIAIASRRLTVFQRSIIPVRRREPRLHRK